MPTAVQFWRQRNHPTLIYPTPPLLVLLLGVLFALHLSHPEIIITSSLICASPTLRLQMLPKFRKQIILWTLEVTPASLGFFDFLQHNKDQGEVRGEVSTIPLEKMTKCLCLPRTERFPKKKDFQFKNWDTGGQTGRARQESSPNLLHPEKESARGLYTFPMVGSASSRGAVFCV